MTNTGTGWTKEFLADGVYFSRSQEFPTDPIYVYHGLPYEFGRVSDGASLKRRYEREGYEFLGPISPSDAEELAELRKAATNAIKLIDEGYGSMAVSLLRAALNPSQLQKET